MLVAYSKLVSVKMGKTMNTGRPETGDVFEPRRLCYRGARVSQLKREQLQNTTLTTGAANPGKSPLSSRIKPLLEMRLEALEHLFFNVFMSVNRSQRMTSQVLRSPSNSKMNSSTSPSWSRYFSRRCCLQMSAVCFCRFLDS